MNVNNIWYRDSGLARCLLPLSWLYRMAVVIRRGLYRVGFLKKKHLSVPVVVVGNVTVGGTGKTPLVIALFYVLKAAGFSPGIIGRGYRGRSKEWPRVVSPSSDPLMVGDEAVMIARATAAPVCVGPKRVDSATLLVEHFGCDCIISDDGLQHLALARDLEVSVIDQKRAFGNRYHLPAGPLRDAIQYHYLADFPVCHGLTDPGSHGFRLEVEAIRNVADPAEVYPLTEAVKHQWHAVAGIGDPDRFFDSLSSMGLDIARHPFSDHHAFTASDWMFDDHRLVLMTEKDAVKCRHQDPKRYWYVSVRVVGHERWVAQLVTRLRTVLRDKQAHVNAQ